MPLIAWAIFTLITGLMALVGGWEYLTIKQTEVVRVATVKGVPVPTLPALVPSAADLAAVVPGALNPLGGVDVAGLAIAGVGILGLVLVATTATGGRG